jgi:hypothetical protein
VVNFAHGELIGGGIVNLAWMGFEVPSGLAVAQQPLIAAIFFVVGYACKAR